MYPVFWRYKIPSEGQDRHSGVHPHVIQMEAHQAHSYQINSTYHIYIYICEGVPLHHITPFSLAMLAESGSCGLTSGHLIQQMKKTRESLQPENEMQS